MPRKGENYVEYILAAMLCVKAVLKLLGIIRKAALYLNVYVPQLQREGGVAAFFRFHRGHRFARVAAQGPRIDAIAGGPEPS
jgi:hypothetical protein